MATKQEKAVQRALKKQKKQTKIRGEKHLLWLLTALLLFLLYLLFAQHYAWWPYSRANLGSAFYTNVSATAPTPAAASGLTTSGSTGSSTTAGSTGSSQAGGSGSSSSGSGTTPTAPSTPASPSIAGFSAGVNVGDTKAQTSTQASGLGQNCAVIANATASTAGGQQEVCVYTQGDKIVTVTYLNGHVISASKSGF